MIRPMEQVLNSQKSMLDRLGKQDIDIPSDELERAFLQQTTPALCLLKLHGIPTLKIDYSQAVHQATQTAQQVREFLGQELDTVLMARTVDSSLYREHKKPSTDNL